MALTGLHTANYKVVSFTDEKKIIRIFKYTESKEPIPDLVAEGRELTKCTTHAVTLYAIGFVQYSMFVFPN